MDVKCLPIVLWRWIATWLRPWDIIQLRWTCHWLRRLEVHRLPHAMRHHTNPPRDLYINLYKWTLRFQVGLIDIVLPGQLQELKIADRFRSRKLEHEAIKSWAAKLTAPLPSSIIKLKLLSDQRLSVGPELMPLRELQSFKFRGGDVTWLPCSLTFLDVSFCDYIAADVLRPLVHLRVLRVTATGITWIPPSVEELDMEYCDALVEALNAGRASWPANLQILNICLCTNLQIALPPVQSLYITDTYLGPLPISLTSLDLDLMDVTMDLIGHLTQLRRLRLNSCNVTWLPPDIEKLYICQCTGITDIILRPLIRLTNLIAFETDLSWIPPNVQMLVVNDCDGITDGMLQTLTNVTELDIGYTSLSWIPPSVEILNVTRCSNITMDIIMGLPRLRELTVDEHVLRAIPKGLEVLRIDHSQACAILKSNEHWTQLKYLRKFKIIK